MELYEKLLIAAGAVTALATLIKPVKTVIVFFQELKTEVKEIKEHCKDNYMRELQIIIMSEDFPLGERLQAGEEYVNRGGNGEIKAKYQFLAKRYEAKQKTETEEKK